MPYFLYLPVGRGKYTPFPVPPRLGPFYLPSCTTSLRMPWRQSRLARSRAPGKLSRTQSEVLVAPRRLSAWLGPCWQHTGCHPAARWEGTRGRSERTRPQLAWSRPVRFGPGLIRKEVCVSSSAATPYMESGWGWGWRWGWGWEWGWGMTSHGGQSPSAVPYEPTHSRSPE